VKVRAVAQEASTAVKEFPANQEWATTNAGRFNFDKLDDYSLAELEELYIDSLWCYYRDNKGILEDTQFDKLKGMLYKLESGFPTLKKDEVAFVEASIAYYRGMPVVSDDEYKQLKDTVQQSGRRKDVTAFLLYERGEQFLDSEQFAAMKDEYEKLGITAVNFEQCNLAQLEEMYVDALWAYYNEGIQLLSDEQYNKLKSELQWQASGFPSLSKTEVEFVKASIAYWRGEPVMSDEDWTVLKDKVLSEEKRKDVTAFLLYSKGKEALDGETFDKMKEEMSKMGVVVQRVGTKALEQTLSIGSDKLTNDIGQVLFMVSALAGLPTILCTGIIWAIGLFLNYEFVPKAEWNSVLQAEFIPLFGLGLVLGLAVTFRLLVFLDLQGPRILCGGCPSCGSEIRLFSGGADPPVEVAYSCKDCGCKMVLNTRKKRITSAGMGAQIEDTTEDDSFDFRKAWESLKTSAKSLVDS